MAQMDLSTLYNRALEAQGRRQQIQQRGQAFQQDMQAAQLQQREAEMGQAAREAQFFVSAMGEVGEDPEALQQGWSMARQALARAGGDVNGLSDVFNPQQFRQIQGLARLAPAAQGGPDIGTYNPRDYTTESWTRFVQSGDPSVLQRYEREARPRIFQGGDGVSYLQIGTDIKPLNTPEDIAAAQALIAEQKAAGSARGQAAGESQTEDARIRFEGAVRENDAVLSYIDEFISPEMGEQQQLAMLDLIYGRGESLYPDLARSQAGIDAKAARDFIINNLSLENAQKLKGQGQITENEREMLNRAATILGDPDISPALARRELQRVQNMFRQWRDDNLRRSGGGQQPSRQPPAQTGAGRFQIEVID